MGRKIPTKKHKKIKDPLKQQKARFQSIKNKINAPPTDPDEQAISKTLQRVIDLKERVKSGIISEKRPKRKKSILKGLISVESKSEKKSKHFGKPEKPVPAFKQQAGESDACFLKRVHQEVQTVLNENAFEKKFNVDIIHNAKTGEVDVVKRGKDELEKIMKEVKADPKRSKKYSNLTKSQTRAQKIAKKKQDRELNNMNEFDHYKDRIGFGEVAHAPPTLNAPKKAIKSAGASRPGRKDLLLKTVLKQNETKVNVQAPKIKNAFKNQADSGVINRKAKRKTLPIGVRKQLESTRDEMINTYRMLKAKKNNV